MYFSFFFYRVNIIKKNMTCNYMYNINTDFKTVEEISKKYTFVYITIIQILASKPGTHFAKKTK